MKIRTMLDHERRERLDIVLKHLPPAELLRHYDVEIKNRKTARKGGEEFEAVCPFHESESVNFSMNSISGRFLCRSAFCGKAGDPISFVIHQEDCSPERAYLKLCSIAKIKPPKVDELSRALAAINSVGHTEHIANSIENPEPIPWPTGYKVMAHPYLRKKRRISKPVLVAAQAGFNERDPFYRYRACIPIVRDGRLYSMYSRAIASQDAWAKHHPKIAMNAHKYYPRHHYSGDSLTSHQLYGIDAVEGDTIILVEAIISRLRLQTLGFEGVGSLLKARISDAQIKLLMEKDISRVLVCTDNDLKESKDRPGQYINPGMKAAWTIYRKLKDHFEVGICKLPTNVDPADLDEPEEFQEVLDNVIWPQDMGGTPQSLLDALETV